VARIDRSEINVAVVAPSTCPVNETGGAEVFTGTLANALAEQGFSVRVYGQEGPSFGFVDGVTYVPTSPTANKIMDTDGIGLRKAVNDTGMAAPLKLAMDIAQVPDNTRWVVIDNDTASLPLAPFLKGVAEHIFVQHSPMTPHRYGMYQQVKQSGGRIVAIADHQREHVAANFGDLHDITIKNGINTRDFDKFTPKFHNRGEPVRVGTLSRIASLDIKGVQFAARAVEKLLKEHDASLTIAGPVADQAAFESVVVPLLGDHARYMGAKNGEEKAAYLADMHVGAALSNPGGWDERTQRFMSCFKEGSSLVLLEMIYSGTIPVSSDSGGAEAMMDAGLGDFIVPLDILQKEGMDAFTDCAARKMLEAARFSAELSDLRKRVRTIDDLGYDYAGYIMDILNVECVVT